MTFIDNPLRTELESDRRSIAVPFSDPEITDEELAEILPQIDVAELRIDAWGTNDFGFIIDQVARFEGTPALVTNRPQSEDPKSKWRWTEGERQTLAERLLVVDAVHGMDIELRSDMRDDIVMAGFEAGKVIIASVHDFADTPRLKILDGWTEEARESGAGYVKIATRADTTTQHNRLISYVSTEHKGIGKIVVGIGKYGESTRVNFPMLGSRLTYAHAGTPNANGQMHYSTLRRFHDYLAATQSQTG